MEKVLERGAWPEELEDLDRYIAHTRRQIDQTHRRILQGEVIPQEEKVLSVFEEHTRWISKGKAGLPVELGVPVAIVEDHILEHQILWQGGDTDAAVPVLEATRLRFPELLACSFDRGFHSPQNQAALGDTLELNAMPAKGRLSASRSAHEAQPDFALARQQHPAVESAINNLEQRGLDRVRTHGKAGFARTVALSHPRCKCAPCRFLDPRTGTRTTQAPATKCCLTSPGNRASAARTGLLAALHGRYFQKSPIWAPKSPPDRRLTPNVADQVHLTLNPPVRSGSNLTAEAGSNFKKGVFGRHYISPRPNGA